VPPHIVDKLSRATEYTTQHGNCYYCDLIREKRLAPRRIFHDDSVIAFTPYASIYNYEAWILPKRHVDSITQLTKKEMTSMAKALKGILGGLYHMQLPYNLYMHQVLTNDDEHVYLRVAPRRDFWAGIELGSRLIINTISPEDAAAFYRKHVLR
jgi:UDPglucose--hexose-1-phosphate uridylyltransferase